MHDVVRADPRYRRKALLVLVASVVLVALAVTRGIPALQQWVVDGWQTGDLGRKRMICIGFGVLITALAAAVVFSGLRFARIGRRIAHEQRFPHGGVRLLMDARVVTGAMAVRLGRTQRFLGITLALLGALLFLLGAYIVFVLWP